MIKQTAEIVKKAMEAAPAYPGLKLGAYQPATDRGIWGDGFLMVKYGRAKQRYRVEVKTNVHVAVTRQLIESARRVGGDEPLLLIASHVRPVDAERLKQAGIAFLDMAGNACLDFDGLHLLITGKKRSASPSKTSADRVFQRNGLKLVFALLTDPLLDQKPERALLNKTFREMSAQAEIALGSIGSIFGALEEQGYLIEEASWRRRLVERRRLLDRWVISYASRMRPKLVRERYHSGKPNWWKEVVLNPDRALWGGEVAGAKLTGYLKPEIITLYLKHDDYDLILQGDLRKDPDGEVEVLSPFWGSWLHARQGDCTHPLLVYADLLASGDNRNLETAQRVYDKFLRPVIEAA